METTIQMRKSQEVSERYDYYCFREERFKIWRANRLPPPPHFPPVKIGLILLRHSYVTENFL